MSELALNIGGLELKGDTGVFTIRFIGLGRVFFIHLHLSAAGNERLCRLNRPAELGQYLRLLLDRHRFIGVQNLAIIRHQIIDKQRHLDDQGLTADAVVLRGEGVLFRGLRGERISVHAPFIQPLRDAGTKAPEKSGKPLMGLMKS